MRGALVSTHPKLHRTSEWICEDVLPHLRAAKYAPPDAVLASVKGRAAYKKMQSVGSFQFPDGLSAVVDGYTDTFGSVY